MIIMQAFVFNKTYHLVLRDSALVHPERAPSVHPKVYLFAVYFFVTCFFFPRMPLNRTNLIYGTMKLKADAKFVWMIDLHAIYLLGPKSSLLVDPESVL